MARWDQKLLLEGVGSSQIFIKFKVKPIAIHSLAQLIKNNPYNQKLWESPENPFSKGFFGLSIH